MVVALVALILVPNVALSKQPILASHLHPGVTTTAHTLATANVPTPTLTLAPTPTPTQNTSYTADDLVQAFQAAGLPTDNLSHGDAIREAGITAVPAQSSVIFEDPSLCGGFNWLIAIPRGIQ